MTDNLQTEPRRETRLRITPRGEMALTIFKASTMLALIVFALSFEVPR